jgi:hypothetical protein
MRQVMWDHRNSCIPFWSLAQNFHVCCALYALTPPDAARAVLLLESYSLIELGIVAIGLVRNNAIQSTNVEQDFFDDAG